MKQYLIIERIIRILILIINKHLILTKEVKYLHQTISKVLSIHYQENHVQSMVMEKTNHWNF